MFQLYRGKESDCCHNIQTYCWLSLADGGVGIGIDKSADFRVVVAALEVVQPGFTVIHIAPIAQGVDVAGPYMAYGIRRAAVAAPTNGAKMWQTWYGSFRFLRP